MRTKSERGSISK